MFKENKKVYTDDEYIIRMWEKEYLQDMVGRFMFAWSNGERREALDKYWVQKTHNQRDASFGVNNGFYVGMEEVVRHFVEQYEDECKADLKAFQDARPEKGYTGADLGMGKTTLHDCTTPLLFIADDGQTARYLCYDVGMDATGKPDGTSKSYFEIALCFIEFIKEDQEAFEQGMLLNMGQLLSLPFILFGIYMIWRALSHPAVEVKHGRRGK